MSSPEFGVSVASEFASYLDSCESALSAPEDPLTCSRGGMGAIWINGGVVTCLVADTVTACDKSCAQLKDPVRSSSKTGSVRELTKELFSRACVKVSHRNVFGVITEG
jgi:hypothetical protein